MLDVVGSNLTIFNLEPTLNIQLVATRRDVVAKRTQHVTPNNTVAICCVEMLRSLGGASKRVNKKF